MSIKSLATMAVLAAIGVGLYIKINNAPEPIPPAAAGPIPESPPMVELGDPSSPLANLGPAPTKPAAAPVSAPTATSSAPPFVPPTSSAPSATSAPPVTMSPAAQDKFSAPPEFAPSSPTTPPTTTTTTAPAQNTSIAPATPTAPPVDARAGYPAPQHTTYPEAWNAAQEKLRASDLDGALVALSPWYRHPELSPEEARELETLLGQLAGSVIYSSDYSAEQPYLAAASETLDDVARKYNVTAELLAAINGLDPASPLTAGQRLKVVRGPFSATVDAPNKEMVLWLAGRYAGRFPIGVGQERADVAGVFSVGTKLLNPPYFGTERAIDPGSPDNPLGAHWIGLNDPSGNIAPGPFGIHGTNDPGNIDGDPRGFIRLHPRDAEHAYYILGKGSSVTIRR